MNTVVRRILSELACEAQDGARLPESPCVEPTTTIGSGESHSPEVRLLDVEDLPCLLGIQDCRPQSPAWSLKTEQDLRGYLDGSLGAAYGVFEETALVATSLLRIPDWIYRNQGPPFPRVPDEEWPVHAGFLENTMVLPEARGRGFQRTLFQARLIHALSVNVKWLCAGIHLQNTVSWSNCLTEGMAIVGIRSVLGYPTLGLLRSLTSPALRTDPNDLVFVRAGEPAEHEAALRDGYVGVKPGPAGSIVYQRLASQPRSRFQLELELGVLMERRAYLVNPTRSRSASPVAITELVSGEDSH